MGRPLPENIPDRSVIQDATTDAVWNRGDPIPSMHVVADLYGVPATKLQECTRDMAEFVRMVTGYITWRGAEVISHVHHSFGNNDSGAFTLVFLLKESHVTMHTWPEFGFVALDAFTCGPTADPGLICRDIAELLGAQECDITLLVRGPSDDNMAVRTI